MRRNFPVLVVIFVLMALVVTACAPAAVPETVTAEPVEELPTSPPAATEEPSAPEGETTWASRPFTYAGESYPTQIDPGMAVDFPGTQANHIVYETLIQYEFGTTNLRPVLATEWEISDDGLEYSFKLREGVTFHDGSEFNADDVKFTYERIVDGEMGMANFLGTTFDHVEIDGPYDVRLVLNQPDANFIWIVPMVRIVPDTALEHEVDGDLGVDYLSSNMIGTGPYKVDRLDPPNTIFYSAYEDYWRGWEGKHFREVIFRWGMDFSSKLLQLEGGSLDLMPDLPPEEVERLESDPNITVVEGLVPRGMFYSMNTQTGPLADAQVRHALQLAFPYESMPEVFPNFVYITNGALPFGLADHDEDAFSKWEQDKEAAQQILEEAGYEPGELSITMGVITDFTVETLPAQLLQEELADIGVELVIEPVPWATLSTAMTSLDTAYDMGALFMNAKTPYAGNYLHQLGHSSAAGGNWNWSYYQNPEFDALLNEAAASPDPEVREELLTEAHGMLLEDAVHLWALGTKSLMAHQSDVKGYVFPTWSWSRVVDVYPMWLDE